MDPPGIGKQKKEPLILPLRSFLVVALVLVVVAGLFVLFTVLGSSGRGASFFGETYSSADEVGGAQTSAGGDTAGTEGAEEETAVDNLEIAHQYSHLYPNEAKIATFLHERGLDDMHIAAIIGVFKRESGNGDYDIDPAALEDNLIGHGIAQWSFERWSGAHYGRPEQGLKYYALDSNRDWADLSIQLDYLWAEMTGEGPAVEYVYVQYSHEDFLATSTLEEAVDFYLAHFMNCGGAQYDERFEFARNTYEKIAQT